MKIIHTSDWHLGQRLYNYDRTDEEEYFFDQLVAAVGKEHPDALLVSGDVFHTGTPGNDVAKRFTERLLDVQAKCPEMETVVIAGNHDSYSRLVVDEALWRRCRVHVLGTPAEDERGMAEFSESIIEIPGKGMIAAVPFCHSRNFPMVESASGEDRVRNYFEALAQHVKDRANGLPTVLMAHLAVAGDLDFRGHDKILVVGGEESIGLDGLGSVYDYVALGHIHCPQWVKGEKKVARYCGTPRAIHFDEMHGHGVDVVAVTAGNAPVVRTEAFEPLHPLVTLGGEGGMPFDDVLKLVAETDLAAGAYIRLNVRLEKGELPGPDWTERSRQACQAKNLRFCLNNPICTDTSERQEHKKMLTMAELKELSDDEVLQILSTRHELSARQCELIKSIMKEMPA